ncbi:MAG: hypothetical protein ACW99G_23670 [Candidatus Thorarchaeota archaeon]|jgi:hypothetical protein
MAELQLKFQAHLYRPDGSLIGTVRAVYDDSHGPCVKWQCLEPEEMVGRVEVKIGAENLGGITVNKKFKKNKTLIVPLALGAVKE